VQAFGEKEVNCMKKKIVYTDEPMETGRLMPRDFLPPPEKLVLRPENIKVTMSINTFALTYFKQQAKKLKVPYQTMIRNLLDLYVKQSLMQEKKK
jgi:hypothetical protein